MGCETLGWYCGSRGDPRSYRKGWHAKRRLHPRCNTRSPDCWPQSSHRHTMFTVIIMYSAARGHGCCGWSRHIRCGGVIRAITTPRIARGERCVNRLRTVKCVHNLPSHCQSISILMRHSPRQRWHPSWEPSLELRVLVANSSSSDTRLILKTQLA